MKNILRRRQTIQQSKYLTVSFPLQHLLKMEFKVIVLLVAVIGSASCFSKGAPDSECESLTPRHHVEAQKSTFPYNIVLSKKQIRSGETITVTIKGKSADDTIKGFIAQARVGSASTPIGSFDASPSSQYAQIKNCGNSKGVSLNSIVIDQC